MHSTPTLCTCRVVRIIPAPRRTKRETTVALIGRTRKRVRASLRALKLTLVCQMRTTHPKARRCLLHAINNAILKSLPVTNQEHKLGNQSRWRAHNRMVFAEGMLTNKVATTYHHLIKVQKRYHLHRKVRNSSQRLSKSVWSGPCV